MQWSIGIWKDGRRAHALVRIEGNKVPVRVVVAASSHWWLICRRRVSWDIRAWLLCLNLCQTFCLLGCHGFLTSFVYGVEEGWIHTNTGLRHLTLGSSWRNYNVRVLLVLPSDEDDTLVLTPSPTVWFSSCSDQDFISGRCS
jgi:hypothetical protein